jgi:DNA-binding SARP family transcriptional activator
LELLLQAAKLYRGDFLPNSAGDMWVIPLARWYRSMYINCAHDALELLTRKGHSVEAEELCAKALRTDPFDERLLEYRLRSLLAQGKNTEAIDEYKRMETMFYDVLCVQFSENLCALYSQIQKPTIKEGTTLEAVIDEFLKDADYAGAYYCDIAAFKTMCQIEARSMSRSGRTTFIARFDTKHEPRS